MSTYKRFVEIGGSSVVVMTSSYSDSVFLYLVNSRHIHTSIIIMREIITTIMIQGNITVNNNCVLGGGVPTGTEGVRHIDISIREYNTIDI